jgi:hypothetical protein
LGRLATLSRPVESIANGSMVAARTIQRLVVPVGDLERDGPINCR